MLPVNNAPPEGAYIEGSSTRVLVKAYPHAAVLIGFRGMVAVFNTAAATHFPYLRENQPLSFAIRDPELLDAVALTLLDGEARRFEVTERLPVERAFAVHVAQVASVGALVVFDDLSVGRKLERMRVDFVANASHELRTPLASLLGFVETLQGSAKDDSEARGRFLGIMEVQAKRMARLIDDLLSLSRIELNANIRPSATIDLSGIVRQITDALKPLAHDRAVEIVLDLPALPALVAGDGDELLRVFENLIENAIKYGASGGRILIQVNAKETREITAVVRDFGVGIPADHLTRLTERFYRVDNAASREAGGTGLGLAIVKHIVLRHGGRLEIESTLGKGSTFRVFFPRISDATRLKPPEEVVHPKL
jgi:two-component system, OmpR family, phosphate regulon sensor histidine kinase PhoR